MDVLVYAGVTIKRSDVATYVAAVVGGRIPQPRRGPPPTDDPVDWLDGLIEEAKGHELEPDVHRSFEIVLRTGAAHQIRVIAELAHRHRIFDLGQLIDSMRRPVGVPGRATTVRLAEVISEMVLEGAPYDERLRSFHGTPRVRDALLPLWLTADREWALEVLKAELSTDSERVRERLGRMLERVGERKHELEHLLRTHGLLEADDDEVEPEAAAEPAPAASPEASVVPAHEAGFDVRSLPWRGQDGGWFHIPEDLALPAGTYVLRRGLQVRRVEPVSLVGREIDAATARVMRAGQLSALWNLARDHSGDTTEESSAPSPDEVAQRLARTRGQVAASLSSPAATHLLQGLAALLKGAVSDED